MLGVMGRLMIYTTAARKSHIIALMTYHEMYNLMLPSAPRHVCDAFWYIL
jgi:hypothetical protein